MLTIYAIMTYISGILYYVSTTINPILYQIMSLKFREAFKDTIARCCGFRSLKGGRARRPYSILSRSAQRTLGSTSCAGGSGSGAGPDSTDYSGNSTREESVATGGRAALKSTSSTDTISKLPTPRKGPHADFSFNETSPGTGADPTYQRPLSIMLSARHGQESNIKATVVPAFSRQNTHSSQRPFLSSRLSISEKKFSPLKNRHNQNFWKILNCVSSSANPKEDKRLTITYSPAVMVQDISVMPSAETFNMMPVSMSSNSLNSNVSNSSLRDVEKGALEDELTSYMQELQRREQF